MKYPGSKWRLAPWIISHFPEHHSYLEPYFGSGAVHFNKERSNIENINDSDGNVVDLFRCMRERPDQLARAIYLTPYSRQVYEDASNSKLKSGVAECDTTKQNSYVYILNSSNTIMG